MPVESDSTNIKTEAPRGLDAVAQQGAALSNPAEARLAMNQSQPSSVSAYLPECDLGEFMKTPGRFESIDKDRSKFITADEISEALKTGKFTDSEKITLRYMRSAIQFIEEASNDEWGDENDGITKEDVAKFKPFEPTLGQKWLDDPFDKEQFHIWTDVLADKLGIRDQGDQELTNAFRHTLTSAIYALKYGETLTNAAGELNEVQRKVRDYFTETGDHWWKDSKADTYNNSQGFALAKQLEETAKRTGKPVTVDDVVRAANDALRNGKLITNVNTGANQNGKVLQKPE